MRSGHPILGCSQSTSQSVAYGYWAGIFSYQKTFTMMKKLGCLLIGVLMLQQLAAQGRHVLVDSLRMWVHTQGLDDRKEGQPVVVFENGHGVPLDNWEKVWPGVAECAPFVAYDRPGIGKSDSTTELPTIQHVSDRLVNLLETLEVEPPYILVGHSLGGLYVRGFPIYYPDLLAGLVIVDPADFTETHSNQHIYYEGLGLSEYQVDSLIQSFIDRRNARHLTAAGPVSREGLYLEDIRAREFSEIMAHPLPNIPVHILTGGRFDMPKKFHSPLYDEELLFRNKLSERIRRWIAVVQTVDNGTFLYSSHAGHYVQWDDPELVISSIRLAIQEYHELKEKE